MGGQAGASKRSWFKRGVLIGIPLLAVAFYVGVAMTSGARAARLESAGRSADAVVTEVQSRKYTDHTTVEFLLPSGQRVSAWCESCADGLRLGDHVRIRYDLTEPERSVEQVGRTSHRNVARFSWFAAGALAVGTIVIAIWLLRPSRPTQDV